MKRPLKPRSDTATEYPDRASGPTRPGRRRFLKQIGTAAGGAGLLASLGLPQLSHGQSVEFNFDALNQHPHQHQVSARVAAHVARTAARETAVAEAEPAAEVMAGEAEAADMEFSEAAVGGDEAVPSEAALAEPMRDGVPVAPAEGGTPSTELLANPDWVAEDRALWVEPGYIVLVRLSRPPDNLSVIEAFEACTPDVGAYLTEHITDTGELHQIPQLHTHEVALVELIAARIAPATISVLHLDHDCSTVCAGLAPEPGWPVEVILGGEAPAPDWY